MEEKPWMCVCLYVRMCGGESPSAVRKMRERWNECIYKNLFVHFYGFVHRFINLSAAERQKHTQRCTPECSPASQLLTSCSAARTPSLSARWTWADGGLFARWVNRGRKQERWSNFGRQGRWIMCVCVVTVCICVCVCVQQRLRWSERGSVLSLRSTAITAAERPN